MVEYKFWFFIEKEMKDIIKELDTILTLNESHRDYEDTWEWYEYGATDQESKDIYINISREHNWRHGMYDCPVILIFRNSGLEVDEIGHSIAEQLGVKVNYGEVMYGGDSDYKYKVILDWKK
ncbi:hypothetical protein MNQ98_21150 [Paenibacillus sp. N3/727]|uniref:hypothetical protein n=1 Tax=Paenibacillus sp. N3/727 TaxID=2925845 RepID=UPI001F535577|nr:hypothetical protein [Paenibacillus sp. N3/727]UNK16979.1 hypothetical protein MNQ98_21150 [Paenibacillus sp. N3/727]